MCDYMKRHLVFNRQLIVADGYSQTLIISDMSMSFTN